MASFKPKRNHQIQLIAAGGLSIAAQGLLILPSGLVLGFSLNDWVGVSVGVALFATATIWIVSVIRTMVGGWRGNAHFILNQAIIVLGMFLLSGSSDSFTRLGGFVLTSLITALTVYGINANTTSPFRTTEGGGSVMTSEIPPADLDLISNAMMEHSELANQKITAERQRSAQLSHLIELNHQLNNEMDPPVAAQLAVNSLERAINCTLVSLMMHDPEAKELTALASSGALTSVLPPGHKESADKGLYGRVARQKKTIIVNDTALETDFVPINNEKTRSIIIVPLLAHGHITGVLEVRSDRAFAFNNADISAVEGAASELTRAWDRADYNRRLTELIQSGISLTTLLDPQAAVEEIAILARKTFDARFVFVTLLDQQGDFSRTAHSGDAPRLLQSLRENPSEEPLMQAALNAAKPFRVRDLRKYTNRKSLIIDDPGLRSLLAIPIRLHRLSIGTILVVGRHKGVFFSEGDESLAELLGSQAAASVESSWLYQELRNKEVITSMLLQLNDDVSTTEDIQKAAGIIARVAHKAANAAEAGVIVITQQGDIQASVELDAKGFHDRQSHPLETIQQAIQTRQSMHIPDEKGELACYPLFTRSRPVGAMWLRIKVQGLNYANFQLLANQAAVILERVNLLAESRRQAREIEAAYDELERTYDQTLKALMSALDARDRETEGHSMRVSRLACLLGERIGLNEEQLKALERGALLHDIGKIGISDIILHKPGRLTDDEWKIMRMHPEIGARIVERIPFLKESIWVVRYHHERWDGSGYPLGLQGREIPIHSRIFAVVDVFDALTSNRIYRRKSTPEEALQYLRDHAKVLFDSEVVEALAGLPYSDFIEGGPAA